jgi:hypothetical protein
MMIKKFKILLDGIIRNKLKVFGCDQRSKFHYNQEEFGSFHNTFGLCKSHTC